MLGKVYIVVIAALGSIVTRYQGFHSISIFLLLALIYFFFKHKHCYSLLLTATFSFLFFLLNPFYFPNAPDFPSTNVLSGKIHSIPKWNGHKLSFEMKANKDHVQVIFFPKTEEDLQFIQTLSYGSQCSFTGTYKIPNEKRNFDSFNFKEYLATKKIYFQFIPENITSCKEASFTVFKALQKYRQLGINYINNHFPDESKGVIAALLFGDRDFIDEEVLESYQSLGIVHLLAVSGLHVGLVSAFVYFFFIRIGMTKERTIDLLLLLMPMYIILAGGAPSVVRATFMYMVVLLSLRLSLKINPLDGISLVCLLMLIVNPAIVFHIGFQLSFLVSYTLIISANAIFQRFSSWFFQLTMVTIIAQLISFPLIIYHFFEISLLSIPLNLVYIPFITFFVLPFSFILFFCKLLFSPLADFLLSIYNSSILWAHNGLEKIMDFPLATLIFGKPPLLFVVCYYLSIGFLFYVWEKNASFKTIFRSSIPFFIIVLFHWHLPYLTNEGEVTMIDVGQGESLLIELPRRKAVYLIDTGGIAKPPFKEGLIKQKQFDVGKDVVLPYLKAKGVRKINKLILTHGHFDHIGGSMALLGKIPVEALLYGAVPLESQFEKELLSSFRDRGTKIIFVKQGDFWRKGKNEFVVLSPHGAEEKVNDRSIVLLATIGGYRWLLTGDLEINGEEKLLATYQNLKADILKVAHHGSASSTTNELLEKVNPSYAFISLGKNNFYGHPHKDVIEKLKEHNVQIFRTDEHGAIRYKFKGDRGFFETAIKRNSP